MTNIIDITLRPGCAIRKIRQDKGWTIKQLAEKSGVHHNQVARIELKNAGGWFTIVSIFQALGVDVALDFKNEKEGSPGGALNLLNAAHASIPKVTRREGPPQFLWN